MLVLVRKKYRFEQIGWRNSKASTMASLIAGLLHLVFLWMIISISPCCSFQAVTLIEPCSLQNCSQLHYSNNSSDSRNESARNLSQGLPDLSENDRMMTWVPITHSLLENYFIDSLEPRPDLFFRSKRSKASDSSDNIRELSVETIPNNGGIDTELNVVNVDEVLRKSSKKNKNSSLDDEKAESNPKSRDDSRSDVHSDDEALVISTEPFSESLHQEEYRIENDPRSDDHNLDRADSSNQDEHTSGNGQAPNQDGSPILDGPTGGDEGVSPLQEEKDGEISESLDSSLNTGGQSTPEQRRSPSSLSWLAEFLCSGRGIGWLIVNILLLVFIILAGLLALFRLLALRSCTPLLSRTLYLMILLLCFTAAAFTAVHLIHLCFGGKEGLPILLTLLLTHTPAPCLSTALTMVLHRILKAARLPWPVSFGVIGRVCTAMIVVSVLGDVTVALAHSTPFLLTFRVTLTAVAMLPVLVYILRFCEIRKVANVLRRELNGELKLMVQPPKQSAAHEQSAAQAHLRDIVSTWSILLLLCCVLAIILWTCNLGMSVFFAVSKVPIWLWWVFHITNCVSQILLIFLLIFACVITQDGHPLNLCRKLFIIPKDIMTTPSNGTANEQRNFVYERVSYSSGPESSQRTSSSQNETDDPENRLPVLANPHPSPHTRPRVTLQRSATFNCAPRLPMMYGYYPGYPHILPQGYPRTGSFAQIHPPYGGLRPLPPSMLLQDGGFVRFNMPLQTQYPMPAEQCQELIRANADPTLFQPSVDIEYNSLRRFPRRYHPRHGNNQQTGEPSKALNKFNPYEIRVTSSSESPRSSPNSVNQPLMSKGGAYPGSVPVSPYHAIPFMPTYPAGSPGTSTFQSFVPVSSQTITEGRALPAPPSLPSRAGSFRNHYAPVSSPHTTSPYHAMHVANASPLPSPMQVSSISSPMTSHYYPMQVFTTASPNSSPYQPVPVSSISPRSNSSRPTSPAITSIAFPPPPTTAPFSGGNADFNPPTTRYNNSDSKLHSPTSINNYLSGPSNFGPVNSNHPSRSDSGTSIPYTQADMQVHPEKSIEHTVREILSSGERPLIRPRRHPSARYHPRRNPSFKTDASDSMYANTEAAYVNNSAAGPSGFNGIPMDAISTATDDEFPNDDVRNAAPSLKRNHSTAGCYYPKERKDSFCQTDDEGNKYSSFRLSQLRQKPADWYGTWAGRRKSKNGAYSIDPNKDSTTMGPPKSIKDKEIVEKKPKDNDRRLSASRASLQSLYSKLKSRKDKSAKEDFAGEDTEKEDRDETETSQASTSAEETPTPSERTDGGSITTMEDEDKKGSLDEDDNSDPLSEALEEIRESKESDADWTMDILSSSSVLSDFYKLRSERPPPLPELSEVDA